MELVKSKSQIIEANSFDEDLKKTSSTHKVDTIPFEVTTICLIFDLMTKNCVNISLDEILKIQNLLKYKPCVVYLKIDTKETIQRLFDEYHLNPLIQAECCEWSFKEKDYVMVFEDFYFIAISDCSVNEDIENPIQIKMLVYRDFIIVISYDKVYFVEKLFNDDLKFINFPKFIDVCDELYLITGNHCLENEKVRSDRKVSTEDCSQIDSIIHKMLETLIARYEKILFALLVECRTCMCYSTEISYKERVEYLVRVSVSEKSLIYLAQLVRPKIQIMKSLLLFYKHDKKFRPYIKCLKGRIIKMNGLIETGTQLLEKAKQLYMTCSDDNLRKTSFSSGGLMKFYAGISTLFLPPALMTGLWGTNVMIPGEQDETTGPFFVMIGVSIGYFIIGFLYLKKIGYI